MMRLTPESPRTDPQGGSSLVGDSDCRHNFCRHFGMGGRKESQLKARLAYALQNRLRAFGTLIVLVAGFGLTRHIFFPADFSLLPPLFVWLTVAAATAYLYRRQEAPLGPLRLIEGWFFAGTVMAMAFQSYHLILEGARLPIAEEAAAMTMLHWFRLCLHMALIIAAYAMFMPASWKRTLAHTLPMAVWPFAFGWWMIGAHAEVAAAAAQQADFEKVSAAALAMATALSIAVFGTYIIDSLRQADYERGFASQYHLEKKLGKGGMGEVWLARHNLLTRPAAIKVIRPEMLRDSGGPSGSTAITLAMKRFEREAQATATLTSPNTIELYDFGTTEDGSFYYVMEYLDGLDLDTLVENHGPVSIARAVYLLTQACDSLADAHEHGLIHRDVKPANIFATRKGINYDFVKVLDFGLVKDVDTSENGRTQLTGEGMASGTPAYMPPEIALGKKDVDRRADIYALGAVGYWLATGQLVFDSRLPMEMVVDHVKTEPKAPSSRTELAIPQQFDEVILRTLAKDPEGRFQSMRQFADALRDIPTEGTWDNRQAEGWWKLHGNGSGGNGAAVGEAVDASATAH